MSSELEQFARYQVKYGRCLLCDMLRATLDEGSRVVFDGPLVAFAPRGFALALRAAPGAAAHQADFLQADPGAVAGALKRALAALAAVTDDGPLNAWLHTTPCARGQTASAAPPFHWHFEIAPRLTTLAGFELGSGIGVDQLEPREAARRLRAVRRPATT